MSKLTTLKINKKILIVISAVLLLILAVGGFFYYQQLTYEKELAEIEANKLENKIIKARAYREKNPLDNHYVKLTSNHYNRIQVNVYDGKFRTYVTAEIVLKVQNSSVASSVKSVLPLIEHKTNTLLSSIPAQDLRSAFGRNAFTQQVLLFANDLLDPELTTLHEINQPLGAIQINSEFLQRKLQDENFDRELITRIAKDIAKDNMRAARIIQTLKAIFTEKYAAISDSNSVIEVINSVLLLSKSNLNQKGIQVELEIENNLKIPMSYGEAQQLFINLFNNSIQALDSLQMPTKIIRIVGIQKGDITEIRFEDNGRGVALDQQSGLFDLFTSTKREGMGLGLWLCNYIVTRHGGRIQYASQQDTGAAFTITFTASN